MAEKYRPSCGTEGADFICRWCGHCERDVNQDCPILANTFVYDVDDPKYPQEWVYGDHGDPCCTAFVELGSQVPTPRCAQTVDMFDPTPDHGGPGGE